MSDTAASPAASHSHEAPLHLVTRRTLIPSPEWGAAALVWSAWAALLALLIALVVRYAGNVPLWDEWQLIPALTSHSWPLPRWYWQAWSEHRVPLPRLLLLLMFRLTHDFRTPMYVGVAGLGLLTALMIRAAGRQRGWISYADLFFPLLLLNPGHEDNFFQGWNIQNVTFTCLAGGVVILMTEGRPLSFRRQATVALLALVLPLTGAAGAAVGVGVSVWVAACAVARLRQEDSRGPALVLAVLSVATAALVAAYFYRLRELTAHTWPAAATGIRGTLMFAAAAFGPAAKQLWPASGWAFSFVAALAAANFALTWFRRPLDRRRLIGLGCFTAAMVVVAAGIGFGRTPYSPDLPLLPRYALLSAPALCAVYLLAGRARPRALGRFTQMVLLAFFLAATPINISDGLAWARRHGAEVARLETDVRAGMPVKIVVARHDWLAPRWRKSDPVDPAFRLSAEQRLLELRSAGVGVFRDLRDTPPMRLEILPLPPPGFHDMHWHDGAAWGHGGDPTLSFSLDRPQRVYGVYFDLALDAEASANEPARFRVSWAPAGRAGERATDQPEVERGPYRQETVAWIDDVINRFDVRPDDRPCVIRLSRVALLVPAADPAGASSRPADPPPASSPPRP